MNLKELRKQAGLTQREMANCLGFKTPQFVSNIERGLAQLPPLHWRKTAKLLKIKPVYFLNEFQKRERKRLGRFL